MSTQQAKLVGVGILIETARVLKPHSAPRSTDLHQAQNRGYRARNPTWALRLQGH